MCLHLQPSIQHWHKTMVLCLTLILKTFHEAKQVGKTFKSLHSGSTGYSTFNDNQCLHLKNESRSHSATSTLSVHLPAQRTLCQSVNRSRIDRSTFLWGWWCNHGWHHHSPHWRHGRWPCFSCCRSRPLASSPEPAVSFWRSTPANTTRSQSRSKLNRSAWYYQLCLCL